MSSIFRKLFVSIFILLSCHQISFSQKRQLVVDKTEKPPKIDGVLDDDVWMLCHVATDFTQFRPGMGKKDSLQIATEVKMTYDDEAIYVGAFLKDDPKKIMRQYRSRDNFGQADFFAIILNPNNDGQNDTEFFVFSSGNQADALATPTNGEDFGWNAVWESKVNIVENGWIVEVKIPYRTLRFSNKGAKTWGVQFHRRFQRDNSQYTWNPIDVTKGSISLYHGEVHGIENIEPPLRLALYPFATTLFDDQTPNASLDFKLGMDVKYGISESFTLDATLIPDFSQVGFDNLALNLGPFEQVFTEQRQFFTEGVELFSKGNLFFSRRIGSAPINNIDLMDNEELLDFPEAVKLLNALKLSGRTSKGLGVGFLNAITEKAEATIQINPDGISVTETSQRKELVEPLSNYSVLVFDQQFNQNSSLSLVNTNVLRAGQFRDANVTGLIADISNKKNSFNLEAQAKLSMINAPEGRKTGFSSFVAARKTNGKFRASIDHSFADKKYDINDLGLLFRNNFNNFGIDLSYRTFQPTKRLNSFRVLSWLNYNRLATPNTFTGLQMGTAYFATTKRLLFFGGNVVFSPGTQFDYFEPRQEGRFFTFRNQLFTNFQISTNRNKKFAVSIVPEHTRFFDSRRKSQTFGIQIAPSLRPTENLSVSHRLQYRYIDKDQGFATTIDETIVFGERDRSLLDNVFSATYNFNELHFLNLNFRHNWDKVNYSKLFLLEQDGSLRSDSNTSLENLDPSPNINFSSWNFDLNYSWQFAPGSFVTLLYRNRALRRTSDSTASFKESLNALFSEDLNHLFSVRLQYFLDVNKIF